MRRHVLSLPILVLALSGSVVMEVSPQTLELAARGPRFIASWTTSGAALDVSSSTVLRRRVSLALTNVTTDQALKEITRQADLEISYSKRQLPSSNSISLHAQEITVAAALTEVLLDAGVDVAVARGGQLALVKRRVSPVVEVPVDSGAVSGRVTDRSTGEGVVGAIVLIQETRQTATTEADGRYYIANVLPGTYSIRARYIGFAPLTLSAVVAGAAEVSVNFELERSAQVLDEVVTTGTVLPTEVKALPTPITIITARDITEQHTNSVRDLFRRAVPSGVSFDPPTEVQQSALSARGANSLAGAGNMKIYIDGIETANFLISAVDPNSIERIEVLRGPQAAVIYGADAAGGVVQIFTKRGNRGLTQPRVEARAEVGLLQTPYDGVGGVARQKYTASVGDGSSTGSYYFGGTYTHLGDWLPSNEPSQQTSPSLFGSVAFDRGIIAASVSGRYLKMSTPVTLNPLFAGTGFPLISMPFYERRDFTNELLGGRVSIAPTSWWRNTVTVGVDRSTFDIRGTRPRLTTPEDTLLSFGQLETKKVSVAFSSGIERGLGPHSVLGLLVGVDHYDAPTDQVSTAQALNTEGTITTSPPGALSVSRNVIRNTGYFAQMQLGHRETLFLTAGIRGDDNSTFGEDVGTAVSPRVGLSWVQSFETLTMKLRGSFGRSIRAPGPGQAFGAVDAFGITLANPDLAPERQRGWDAGVDLIFDGLGALSVTAYDQTAENLILAVQLPTEPLPSTQFRNLGRVSNRGLEVEGSLALGPVQMNAQYGYVRSRIEDLGPDFVGDLQVGDRPLQVPEHTAGASLTVFPLSGTTITSGVTYVGSWRYYQNLALYSCFGGTGPCEPSFGDYIIDYPGFVKLNIGVSQTLGPHVSGFIAVDNATNSKAYESNDSFPVMGRLTSVGVQVAY